LPPGPPPPGAADVAPVVVVVVVVDTFAPDPIVEVWVTPIPPVEPTR
jgi:hypothetical protein